MLFQTGSRILRSLAMLALAVSSGCGPSPTPSTPPGQTPPTPAPAGRSVTVYTSADDVFSTPIFTAFEKETGIRVDVIADTEAAKTAGLVNRLIAERDRPRADVFWNSEASRTAILWEKGLLTPICTYGCDLPGPRADPPPDYRPPPPNPACDMAVPEWRKWIEFATRARVLIVNTKLVPPDALPSGIRDLANPRWKGRVAMADPRFGTTGSHCSAIFDLLGEKEASEFFTALKANQIRILDGNAAVRDAVGRGEAAIGIVDTDDALGGIAHGLPISMIWPDQDGDKPLGAFLIPNTMSKIKGGPHPAEADALIEYLVRESTEAALAKPPGGHLPLRAGVPIDPGWRRAADIKASPVDHAALAGRLAERLEKIEALLRK